VSNLIQSFDLIYGYQNQGNVYWIHTKAILDYRSHLRSAYAQPVLYIITTALDPVYFPDCIIICRYNAVSTERRLLWKNGLNHGISIYDSPNPTSRDCYSNFNNISWTCQQNEVCSQVYSTRLQNVPRS